MKVSEIMTPNVIGIREDAPVEDAARLLDRHHISGLPVFGPNEQVVGVVSELDIISKNGSTVGEVMARGIISVSPDTSIEEVAHLLANRNIRRVPVIDRERLVGIVSRADLVRQIAMRWVCHVCGEMVRSKDMPHSCPRCGANESAFTSQIELPGM